MSIKTPNDFGAAVRQAREKAGMSQGQLALQIGTTQARVSRFESGDGGINFRTVLQILAALKLQIKLQKQSDNEGVIIDEDEEDIDLGAIANTGVKAFRRAPK